MARNSIEALRERIIRVKAELRRLKLEIKLAEAERRDRERLEQVSAVKAESQPQRPPKGDGRDDA